MLRSKMELQGSDELERTFTRALEDHFNEMCPGLEYPDPPSSTISATTYSSIESFEDHKMKIPFSSLPLASVTDFKYGVDAIAMGLEIEKDMGHNIAPSGSYHPEVSSFAIDSEFCYNTTPARHESIDDFLSNSQSDNNDVSGFNEESSDDKSDDKSEDKSPEEQAGTIFSYGKDDSDSEESIGILDLDVRWLDSHLTSRLIRKSIQEELSLQERYQEMMKSGRLRPVKEKIRKRRNPLSDSLTWEPLSLYTAFTNYKSTVFENTDYYDKIPSSSCFGKINMRVRRAWTRSANKPKN